MGCKWSPPAQERGPRWAWAWTAGPGVKHAGSPRCVILSRAAAQMPRRKTGALVALSDEPASEGRQICLRQPARCTCFPPPHLPSDRDGPGPGAKPDEAKPGAAPGPLGTRAALARGSAQDQGTSGRAGAALAPTSLPGPKDALLLVVVLWRHQGAPPLPTCYWRSRGTPCVRGPRRGSRPGFLKPALRCLPASAPRPAREPGPAARGARATGRRGQVGLVRAGPGAFPAGGSRQGQARPLGPLVSAH